MPVKSSHSPSYDTIKGIAILLVILVHTLSMFPVSGHDINVILFFLGRQGPTLFFLISGLILTLSWKSHSEYAQHWPTFYKKRFLRIAPLFWLAIAVYTVIRLFVHNMWAQPMTEIKTLLLTASFLNGFALNAFNMIVPGGWYIADIVLLYAIFPLLMTWLKRPFDFLYLALGLYFANQLFLAPFLQGMFQAEGYFNELIDLYLHLYVISQAPYFLLGIFLANLVLGSNYVAINRKKISILAFGSILGAISISFLPWAFGGIKPCIYFATSIFLALGIYQVHHHRWHVTVLDMLGRHSYCLYLFHFVALEAILAMVS